MSVKKMVELRDRLDIMAYKGQLAGQVESLVCTLESSRQWYEDKAIEEAALGAKENTVYYQAKADCMAQVLSAIGMLLAYEPLAQVRIRSVK